MSYSEVLDLNFLGRGEEPRRTPVGIVRVPAQIQTGRLKNRDGKLYCFIQHSRWYYL